MQPHPDPEVQAAIVRLLDELCSYERATGRESVLILRGAGGFEVRAMSGKPLDSTQSDIQDGNLFASLIF